MRTFEFDSVEESYSELLKALLNEGKEVSPRGQLTREITPACITIKNPTKRIISSKARKLNYGFMCAELTWMLSASNSVDFIGHYNSIWKMFSDDGVTLNGAYGKRIFNWDCGIRREQGIDKDENGENKEFIQYNWVTVNQFEDAYQQLKEDEFTRQATIVLFDPYKDYQKTKDKPCTNLMRFIIRDNKLQMRVFMRSNDIIKGYPYDIFNFTMFQEIMAGMLGIEVGEYVHMVDSFHLYESDFELAKNIIEEEKKSIYDNSYKSAKIEYDKISDVFNSLFNIESLTRLNKEAELSVITTELEKIENNYWRSIAAVLATYNFRKYRRNKSEWDILKGYITNEFSQLINERWHELKPINK